VESAGSTRVAKVSQVAICIQLPEPILK
jgi:hypothetical protein